MAARSYFYLFIEDPYDRDKTIADVATRFRGVHNKDSDVSVFRPGDPPFEPARQAFRVRKLPAVAVADQPQTFERAANPSVAFNRDILDLYQSDEQLYRFLSDLHYLVRDEDILQVKLTVAQARVAAFFKGLWEQVRDSVSINLGV